MTGSFNCCLLCHRCQGGSVFLAVSTHATPGDSASGECLMYLMLFILLAMLLIAAVDTRKPA